MGRRARSRRREDARGEGQRGAAQSILPYSYGGSNGLLTQDNLDATLWRRFGTSRLARTVCAAPTGAANMALYGKMPSVTYEDYPDARLIVLWGVNPNASGIHLIPYVREAQKRGAKLVVDRSAVDAAGAQPQMCIWRSSPAPISSSRSRIHRYLFANGFADEAFLREHTTARRARCANGPSEWTIERAAAVAGHRA